MYTETLESKGCPPIDIAIVMATALEILKTMIAICFVIKVGGPQTLLDNGRILPR